MIIICVPTPLTKHREPDLRFIENTADQIAKRLRKEQLVSLESTTYPGTTRELLLPKFEKTGLNVGKDFFLVFSPEREDPGNTQFTTEKIPKIVGEKGLAKNFLHGLGHGIGLDTHEFPSLNLKSKDILKENMVITIEPGIYIKNSFGVRIEDDILVKKDGPGIL